MSRLTLYYSPGACSLAPHIALEEAGADYEATRIDFASAEQRAPHYLAINPKGRVPALAEGDWVLTENPAILTYVAKRFPDAGLWPKEARREALCAEWMAWLSSSVHVAYAHQRRPERYAVSEAAKEDVRQRGIETSRDVWRQVEARLDGGAWALGENYSVVDPYLMVFWTWGNRPGLGFDMAKDCPRWTALARRMAARPAVQRVFAAEGLPLPA